MKGNSTGTRHHDAAAGPGMQHRRSARTDRNAIVTFIATTALSISLVFGIGVGAWALWSANFTDSDVQVGIGAKVGFAVGRIEVATTESASATAPAQVLNIPTLTSEDAETLLASTPVNGERTLAIPIRVQLRADGNLGIQYSAELPSFDSGTVFGESTIRLFPLSSNDDSAAVNACTAAAAPATQPPTEDVVGIATGDTSLTIATDYWCLTVVYTEGGTYTNVGEASASSTASPNADPSPTVTVDPTEIAASDSWQAYVVDSGMYGWVHTVTVP